ncbi:MAG: gamma-glutamyl-gamma-aminobutyrate hydrolase [Saprospiraceae bacterium]|nr:MAG: gamma-glutamyl-gamma-aminobutyrate hydrolase [Saprospiraceae bacterium]
MRLGITQRVEVIPSYGERRDCLDQNWFLFFERLGLNVIPVPNALKDPVHFFEKNDLNGFILSGGNDISSLPDSSNPAPERDKTEKFILEYARSKKLPVIGVCRGLQVMNLFFNGALMRAEGHAGTRHGVANRSDNVNFYPYKEVNSFHNYVIAKHNLGEGLIPILSSNDAFIEAFQHEKLPWTGIMWHPEREHPFNEYDIELFKKIFNITF